MSSPDARLPATDGSHCNSAHAPSLNPAAPRLISRMPPALAALLAHLPGSIIATALMLAGIKLPLPPLLLLVSASAALLAWFWRLPIWWRYINLAFLPLIGLALYAQHHLDGIDPNWFLAAFLLLALTSAGAVRTRVPLYLSSPRAARELALRMPAQGCLIDLGCGLGGPLAHVRKLRPDARLAGVETAPLNWLLAKSRLRGRADIRLGSLWNVDLSTYDIVYAYLSPAPMPRLWRKALAEMKPGSLFISNTFGAPDFEADEIIDISQPGDLSHARLLIRRM